MHFSSRTAITAAATFLLIGSSAAVAVTPGESVPIQASASCQTTFACFTEAVSHTIANNGQEYTSAITFKEFEAPTDMAQCATACGKQNSPSFLFTYDTVYSTFSTDLYPGCYCSTAAYGTLSGDGDNCSVVSVGETASCTPQSQTPVSNAPSVEIA